MSWETRWRDMILAGGSVVVAACSSGQAVTSDVPGDGSNGSSGGSSGGTSGGSNSCSTQACMNADCCNADPDPCCLYENCGGDLTPDCSAEQACMADGGTWHFGSGCVLAFDGGPTDAGPADAPADQASDGLVPDEGVNYPPFCCNANGDPCCQYQYCGGPLTSECVAELACQGDGGVYDPYTVHGTDGGIVSAPGCSFPSPDGGDGGRD